VRHGDRVFQSLGKYDLCREPRIGPYDSSPDQPTNVNGLLVVVCDVMP
jgi:hypothetical protein